MLTKRPDKIPDHELNGCYMVYDKITFELVFVVDLESQNIITQALAMNPRFKGVELDTSVKRYYLMKLGEYIGYTPEWVANRLIVEMGLTQVTLNYLEMIEDTPMAVMDCEFESIDEFAETDQDLIGDNFLNPISLPLLFESNPDNKFMRRVKRETHTW